MNRKNPASPATRSKRGSAKAAPRSAERSSVPEKVTSKKSARPKRSIKNDLPKPSILRKRVEGKARPSGGNNSFPVVGIGASAGGLEAFRQLLEHLRVDTGMAFVLVSHLDPTHKSILTELLARRTKLPVTELRD